MGEYLLVHGGLCVGWVWDDVVKRLETGSHRVHVVDHLPSVGSDPASLGDLTADVGCVRQMLDAIEKPIVLVGHSYSGMVVTEFADHPKVRHTVYLTAMWPERGQSALNLVGDVLPPVFTQRNDGAFEITNVSSSPGSRSAQTWIRTALRRCSRALCCSPIRPSRL
jgi:pimeloyl-ACP methyl ester carboxylesterase